MLSIALSTLRTRWVSFAGAFIALCLGTAIIAMMALALAATFGNSGALIEAQSMAGTTAGITVFVAVFIVLATFAFTVDQRRRELALLQLAGAAPHQVRRMILAESVLLGIGAAALGCVLGALGSGLLRDWMVDHGVAPHWFTIGLNPVALVIAFGLGVGTAVTGAAVVALRASRIQPVEALREAAVSRRAMTPLRVLLGVGMLAAAVIGGVVIARSMPQEAVNPRKYAMVPVLYAGAFALLSPLLLRPVTWLATALPRRAAGPLLVRANLLNSRRRSAATVAPVVIAAGLTAALLCVQAAGADATVNQAREQIHAGYVVVPDDGGQLSAGAVAALLAMQRTVPGLRETSHRSFGINIGDLDGQVIDQLDAQGVPPAAMGTVFTPKVLQGSLDHLGNNSIVVDQDTLTGDDLALGQRILVWLPDGARREVRIAAVVQTGIGTDATYVSGNLTPAIAPDLIWLQVPRASGVGAALRGQGARVVPAASYFQTLRASQRQQSRTAAILILGIAVGYALISVANTLVMAAAGRRRELAALGLAGATRAQTLRVVGAESLLTTIIGVLLAAGAGAATLATQRLSLRQLASGLPVDVPWTPICLVAALCAVTAIAAAVISAARVTSGQAIDAIGARE